MQKFVIASANENKIKEFQEMLKPFSVRVVPYKTLIKDENFEIEETGKTFEENSEIKAKAVKQFCDENNIVKDYFDLEYQKGFEYAYIYPGFTKVIQAVGRVIRSNTDRGVAILMDERFTYSAYQMLMPPHWTNKKVINSGYLMKKEIIDFYKNEN